MEPHDAVIARVIAKGIILIKMSVIVLVQEVFSSGTELPIFTVVRSSRFRIFVGSLAWLLGTFWTLDSNNIRSNSTRVRH
jgi:hypothetical protein